MGIPVRIRTYRKSFLANVISITGTILDALCKFLALAVFFGAISEAGLFPGVILGVIAFVACAAIGAGIQAICDRLAVFIAAKKIERTLKKK